MIPPKKIMKFSHEETERLVIAGPDVVGFLEQGNPDS